MTPSTNCRIARFDSQFMPEHQVPISFRDRSWRYGDGAFDKTRTLNSHPFPAQYASSAALRSG
jgi:branched-chain amino acid aminotransferase